MAENIQGSWHASISASVFLRSLMQPHSPVALGDMFGTLGKDIRMSKHRSVK